MTEQTQNASPQGPEGNSIEQSDSNSKRQQKLEALLARVFLARRVSDLIEINELNADASELDNANPDSWSAMPKVAKDFQSLRLRDDEVDEPASRDDSELEDCDGIAVF